VESSQRLFLEELEAVAEAPPAPIVEELESEMA
jgi:hypothetical protein